MGKNFKLIGDPLELTYKGGENVTLGAFLLRFFSLWPIMIPFLIWGFLLTSLTRQYIYPFVTVQGLIMIGDLLLFYFFVIPVFNRLILKYRKTPIFFISVSEIKYSLFGGILSVIFYWIIVVYIWIPNLPPKYRSLGPEYSNPIFLVSVMSTVFLCLFYGIQLSICKEKYQKITQQIIF